MKVDIIATGSTGNCAVIDDLFIIDVGAEPPTGKFVFLTHCHTDHTKCLDKVAGLPVYCTQDTADILAERFPYTAFNILTVNEPFRHMQGESMYFVTPIAMVHDVPCVGYEVMKQPPVAHAYEPGERIFIATDFNRIKDAEQEAEFVTRLRYSDFTALYLECNNTLDAGDFDDVFFDETGNPPRDEFHRRKSFQNHCNAGYLIDLFTRAGYSEENKYPEPVTLLHKSQSYYGKNFDQIVKLCKIANVKNPLL